MKKIFELIRKDDGFGIILSILSLFFIGSLIVDYVYYEHTEPLALLMFLICSMLSITCFLTNNNNDNQHWY